MSSSSWVSALGRVAQIPDRGSVTRSMLEKQIGADQFTELLRILKLLRVTDPRSDAVPTFGQHALCIFHFSGNRFKISHLRFEKRGLVPPAGSGFSPFRAGGLLDRQPRVVPGAIHMKPGGLDEGHPRVSRHQRRSCHGYAPEPGTLPATVMTPLAGLSCSAMLRVYDRRRFLQVLPGGDAFIDAGSNSGPGRASCAEH